jgi:hypothetical protein
MTVTVAIVHRNTSDVLDTVLQDETTIPVMATALVAFQAWERTFLSTLKPRMIPAPGEIDEAGDFADINALYALVEGRDFPVSNIPARGWTWNSTRNVNEPVFAEPAPEAGNQTEAIERLEQIILMAQEAVQEVKAKG